MNRINWLSRKHVNNNKIHFTSKIYNQLFNQLYQGTM
jgi:hypothetical protein